jgi:hypothetical protein
MGRGLHRVGRNVLVKPFAVLAAKCLGPGRLRLQMIRLAHDLGDGKKVSAALYDRRRQEPEAGQPARPSRRAA